MAKAPRPGVGKRAEAARAAQTVMTIRILDKTYTLTPNNIPFGVKVQVRKSCGGLPIEAYMTEPIGEDSFQVLVWTARLMAGERVTIDDVVAEWPVLTGPDDFDVELDEPDDLAADADPQP